MKPTLEKELEDFAKEKRYKLEESNGSYKLWRNWYCINISRVDDQQYHISISGRFHSTSSYDFGDRSDLTELYIACLAIILYKNGESSLCIYLVDHPAVIGELYAFSATFNQNNNSFTEKKHLIEYINKFTSILFLLEHIFIKILFRNNLKNSYVEEKNKEWEKEIDRASSIEHKCCTRNIIRDSFNLKYFAYEEQGITVFHHEVLINFLYSLSFEDTPEILSGITGDLYLLNGMKHYINRDECNFIQDMHSKLESKNTHLTIGENFYISLGEEYMIVHFSNCCREMFFKEKEHIRQRHINESKILFKQNLYDWNKKIDGDTFEKFCLDLLKAQKNVKWARKVSSGNEPDGGRDIIIEKLVPTLNIEKTELDLVPQRIIVQCKAYQKGVGKSQVRDIRDLLDYHEASGYWLITSSYITTPLTQYFEKLKYNTDYEIDWWTKSEIEDQLDGHPEILNKYPEIVTATP